MSKKETEFDRYDRMKRMEREQEVQKRKDSSIPGDVVSKKGGKVKPLANGGRKKWAKELEDNFDDEYSMI